MTLAEKTKPCVVLYLGPSSEKWDETSLIKGGIGGSETAVICLARELSYLGYIVKIFASPIKEHIDPLAKGVEYLHYSKWRAFSKERDVDYFISSRTVSPLHIPFKAHKKYVWIHDVFLSRDRTLDCALSQVDSYLCLSQWHKQLVSSHHSIPLDKIKVTSNGVDPERYRFPSPAIPSQVFYSSSPDRGLDTLLDCGDVIHKIIPDFKLVVAYGFNNWEKAIQLRKDPEEIRYMEKIKEGLNRPYVKYLGRVDQTTLSKIQQQSSAWLYPTRFHETFCITAAEAGFGRCPILTSKQAGLADTVKDGGILLEGDAYTKEYRQQFVFEAVKLLKNKSYNEYFSNLAYQRMRRFTWKAVATQWHNMFEGKEFEELQ
jgi:glycosyltransferase involved in cell wall biosynthesis